MLERLEHEVRELRRVAAPVFETAGDAGGDLRVEGVKLEHALDPELVAFAVQTMEFSGVVHEEGHEQRVDVVRVRHGEEGAVGELGDAGHDGGLARKARGGRLNCQPLVDEKRLGVPLLERRDDGVVLGRRARACDHVERGEAVRQVVGRVELVANAQHHRLVACGDAVVVAGVLQGADAGARRVGRVFTLKPAAVDDAHELAVPADAEGFADDFARTVDGGGIDDRHGVGDGALARELHRDRTEGGRKVDVVDDGAERLEKRCIDGSLVVGENGAHLLEDRLHHQAVHGLPAVEGIAVGAGKQRKRVGVEADVEDDRRGKAAVEARNGFFAKAREDPGLACVLELEHARELGGAFGLAFEQNGHLAALGVEQRDGEGHEHRFLGGLARRGRRGLLDRHDELARLGVPLRGDGDARGACLRVPAAELLEVAARDRKSVV